MDHMRGSGTGFAVTWTMNMVVPYMTIMSPGAFTPTLMASAVASIVPVVTGVPAFSPVSAAACGVTCPATSFAQSSRGRRSRSTIGPAKRGSQRNPRRSKSGL